ncbi:MAG TPA: sigma-70 family RNA polymerase sigma factor, partial [Actinomycetota bacterium]|nr:sigma-70 family RNA polymerase sigma factor [Actinomycetota bacterium]
MADDRQLVRAHLGGDRGAFSTLMERHQRRVYNIAYRMLGRPEDAADATQDVFLTCLRKLSGYRGHSAFTTWLHRVTVNVCHDALRRRSREQPARDEDWPEPSSRDLADAAVA